MKALWTTIALAAIALSPAAPAQAAWPDKPIHLVVPYPPGGNVDSAARIISDRLGSGRSASPSSSRTSRAPAA